MYKNDTSAVLVKGARYMPCTLTDEENGREYKINVKEPKLRVYKLFQSIDNSSTTDDIINLASAILSSNAENRKFSPEFVENNLDILEVTQLFEDFAAWISSTRTNDPN